MTAKQKAACIATVEKEELLPAFANHQGMEQPPTVEDVADYLDEYSGEPGVCNNLIADLRAIK